MNIFISYRRDDSIVSARLIHNELVARFGAESVFMDIGDIGYGDDFIQAIDRQLEAADVVLVVIGARWGELLAARLRGDDWVRHEIARALQLRARAAQGEPPRPRVLPLLVGAAKPPAGALPDDIAPLQRLSMLNFDERALQPSVNTLVEAVQQQRFEDVAGDLQFELSGRRKVQLAAAAIGVAMFLAGWIALFDFFGLDTRLATATMAVAGLGRSAAGSDWSGRVVLVGIDGASEKAVGRAFDASWRAEHARVIEQAAAAGARTMAFDLVLVDEGPAEANAALERALAATRERMPVVFGAQEMKGDAPLLLPRFAAQSLWGVACAGTQLGRARSMPLAVQRAVSPPPPPDAPPRERYVVLPSLALAAYSAGGRAEPFDEIGRSVQVLLPREQRAQDLGFFAAETVRSVQTGCEAIGPGDRVARQLFDPLALPALREPPQRVAYEQVLRGDPGTLALLKDRIVLVGTQFERLDRLSPSLGAGRWGVELIAAQIDSMARGRTIRSVGGVGQWLLASALGLGGAWVAFRLRRRPLAWRAAAIGSMALLFVVAVAGWYRLEQQLVGLSYGLVALLLGAWVAGRLDRKAAP